MIQILEKEKVRDVWDSSILSLSNPTYYQSYNYSQICKGNAEIEYVYKKNLLDQIEIMGFVKIEDEKVTIPFGPIFTSDLSFIDILEFINDIKKYYNKPVVFSLPKEIIDEKLVQEFNLVMGWCFVTPLVDTNRSIEMIVKGCNENRRRIIRKTLQNISQENIRTGSQYAEEFIDLYRKRMQETEGEMDLSLELLSKILVYDNSQLTVCMDKDRVIAGSVTFEFGDTLITRFNCYDSEYHRLSPIARVDYELLRYASLKDGINYYDMSGLAEGMQISDKQSNLNRYKLSYRPSKINTYQWYRHN